MEKKKVLVIGAGITGVAAIANIKSDGLQPVCYERAANFGGTWHYRNEPIHGITSIMPTTTINHSKEMGSLSNFPPNKEYSNFMKHSEAYQYIKDYVKHNQCEKYIKYNMEVLIVKKAVDYDESGKWSVTSVNRANEEEKTEIFDGVFVATGHNGRPVMPKFPGQDEFSGKIMHTHSLKDVEEFKDKNVVVVGMGCSAMDAAVEISRVSKQVYLSARNGACIWHRCGRNGYPFDFILLRRYLTQFIDILPIDFINWYIETFYIDTLFDQRLYYNQPKYHIMSRDPIVSDQIGFKLISGAVVQKGTISKFSRNGVYFDGEDTLTEVDVVIMATGYSWGFPFLEKGTVAEKDGIIHLYKCVFPPHLPHPTLAILGFINPLGAGFPLYEAQARWASYLIAKGEKLPSKEKMMKDIIERHEANVKRYIPGEKMSVRVDYVQYQDELAKEIGVKPNLLKYFFTDFGLFLKLFFGPSVPYQYRLDGHGKWEGAREAIMTVKERVEWPLTGRMPQKKGIILYILDYIMNLVPLNIYIWK